MTSRQGTKPLLPPLYSLGNTTTLRLVLLTYWTPPAIALGMFYCDISTTGATPLNRPLLGLLHYVGVPYPRSPNVYSPSALDYAHISIAFCSMKFTSVETSFRHAILSILW
ncbi:hypothetical protein FRB95_010313 [Tulasnella sp. JGI-2019a]|nr:hypothetical protein FRB95_010313 [Tulasnella sp. JGI-2019a]